MAMSACTLVRGSVMLKAKIVAQSDQHRDDPEWGRVTAVTLRSATSEDVAKPSPARMLQGALDVALAETRPWSARRRLACMVGASLACWTVLAMIIRALL